METRSLAPDEYAAWDRFAESSPDAWFFHTTKWMAYLKEYGRSCFREDLSFWVTHGGHPLAIVPVHLEEGPSGPRLAFTGEPMAAPAMEPKLSTARRREVLEFAVERLKALAAERCVRHFQLRVPAIAPVGLEAGLPPASPFTRLGAFDMPFQSQVIDLRRPTAEIWSEVRHGTHADIRRAAKTLVFKAWDTAGLTDDKFAQYQALHAKDARRVTRSQATFDMMRGWVRSGNAVLFEAEREGQPAAFALVLLFVHGAYYASSCKDPDHAQLPSSHFLQWNVIEWLKSRGVFFYDLGQQLYTSQWFFPISPKAASISLFKRGLGGAAVPLHTGEFHLDAEGLCRGVEEKILAFRNAGSTPQ